MLHVRALLKHNLNILNFYVFSFFETSRIKIKLTNFVDVEVKFIEFFKIQIKMTIFINIKN